MATYHAGGAAGGGNGAGGAAVGGTSGGSGRPAGRIVVTVIAAVLCIAAIAGIVLWRVGVFDSLVDPKPSAMNAEDAQRRWPRVSSSVDFNGNGVDDYADIVAGARADAERHPQYDGSYVAGGYPPDDRGVCTDVVWRAFKAAGYDLKSMIDADIEAHPDAYAAVAPTPDPNIDFRRVGVQQTFLARYGVRLDDGTDDPADWQGGDIVVFGSMKHIGIVSDARDARGNALIIHNMGQRHRENDYLTFAHRMPVTGHYRFDASKVPPDVLKAWR